MSSKRRISASVDAPLVEAGQRAVESGEAESFSAWLNDALQRHVAHQARLRALDAFIEEFEAQHGEITDQEIRDVTQRVGAGAVVVRRGHSRRRGAA